MARPNPKYSTEPIVEAPPLSGLSLDELFYGETIQTTMTPNGTLPQPQVGAQGQGGCRGQKCNGNGQKTKCYVVYGNQLQLTQAAVDYYKNIGIAIRECGTVDPVVNGNLEQRVKELEQLQWEIYPQAIGTTSQRSDVDIWNHLSQWVWGHGGEKWQAGGLAPKWDKPEPTAIVPHFTRLHTEQEMRITEAHAHRQSIETKVEDLYTKKSDIGHKHGGNGTDWGVVVMGILAIILILLAVKYLFPLLGGLKGILPKRGQPANGDMGW